MTYSAAWLLTDSHLSQICDVPQRQQPVVFEAELGRTLVADLKCCVCAQGEIKTNLVSRDDAT